MTVWPHKAYGCIRAPQSVNPNESGLVGGWNMLPRGSGGSVIVPDESGNANDGTLAGPVSARYLIGRGMRFDGADDYIDIGNTGETMKTVSFWVFPRTTTEDFIDFDAGTHSVEVAAGTVTATGWTSPTIYVDGEASTTLIANKWQHIVVTTDTGFAASNMQIGTETIFLDGVIAGAVEIFSDAKSAAWIAQKYLQGAWAIQFKTDWGVKESVANETGGTLGFNSSPFKISSGTWKITIDTIGGEEVKCIENIAAGILYLPTTYLKPDHNTEAAYGSWEFWIYKGADGNTSDVIFIADTVKEIDDATQNGYFLRLSNSEYVGIGETTAGAVGIRARTAASYINISQWYKIKITRGGDGSFSTYVDDVLFTPDAGNPGTNPFTDTSHTTANYVCLVFDAGDKISYSDPRGDHCISKYLGVV